MALHSYMAYGLRIQSEIPCPELAPARDFSDASDVIIRLLPTVPHDPEPTKEGYFQVQPGVFRLTIPRVARYLIEEGTHIFIEPHEGASIEEVRLFLLGSVMGALLYQRGLFPLHGSAIDTKWGAMIFVGPQKIGKSTLAAHFHRRGYNLLSDDVCAVFPAGDQISVLPALAQIRLCDDAYQRLGQPHGARFHVDKFVVPLTEGYCAQPVPLRTVHLLATHDEDNPEYRVLRGFDRIQILLENLYRPQFLKGQATQSNLMRLTAEIALNATIARVSRRCDPTKIDDLVDFLELAWAQNFDTLQERRPSKCANSTQMTD